MPSPGDIRQSGLPTHDGTMQLRDLKGRVEIVRDEHGVPHITAQSEHDLWFAQGFCHGQDRLWQLERFRRFARGTLSELMGEPLIGVDRFYRRLGVAWSVTNAVADVSDLFVERFNDDFTQYEHQGEWHEPEIWHETIQVKGRDEPI